MGQGESESRERQKSLRRKRERVHERAKGMPLIALGWVWGAWGQGLEAAGVGDTRG